MRQQGFASKIKEIALDMHDSGSAVIVKNVLDQYDDAVFSHGARGRKKLYRDIDEQFKDHKGNLVKKEEKKYLHPLSTKQGITVQTFWENSTSSLLSSVKKHLKDSKTTVRAVYPEIKDNGRQANNGVRINSSEIEDDNIFERIKDVESYVFSFLSCDLPNFVDAYEEGRMTEDCKQKVLDIFDCMIDKLEEAKNAF